jgi:hypothetical protein
MKFSELFTKITIKDLSNQNNTNLAAEIISKSVEVNQKELEYEKEITCRVINGNKVKKRKVKKEESQNINEVEEAK